MTTESKKRREMARIAEKDHVTLVASGGLHALFFLDPDQSVSLQGNDTWKEQHP
eukprot:m.164039 g.164039  ORF g.164039 m.164039 type:complete len:54 (+) comp38859_c0_seq3:271-432(+)